MLSYSRARQNLPPHIPANPPEASSQREDKHEPPPKVKNPIHCPTLYKLMAGLRTHCTHKSQNQASSLALHLHLHNPFLPLQMAPKPDLARVGRDAFEVLETEYLPRKTRPSGPALQSAHSYQPVPSNIVVIQDPPNPMTETVVYNYHYPVRVQPYNYGVRYAPVVETRNPYYYY